MLRIRLRRTGAKKQPRYRVVVAESSAPRDGAYVEVLGWYNPQSKPAQIVLNSEKANAWVAKGARPSDRVAYLLKQASMIEAANAGPTESEAVKPAPRRRASSKKKADETAAVETTATEVDAAPAAETESDAASSAASVEAQPVPNADGGAPDGQAPARPRRGKTASTAASADVAVAKESPAGEAPESEGSAATTKA